MPASMVRLRRLTVPRAPFLVLGFFALWLGLDGAGIGSKAAATQQRGSTPLRGETVVASELLGSRLLVPGGGRVSWSTQGDRIAYDKAGADGRYDLYVRDLATDFERCLTCEFYDFRRAHALNPAWNPSGSHLVFQAQLHPRRLGLDADELASPERALWSDLWLVRADGKDYWRLTRGSEQGSAVLDAHFSFEGEHLLWTERVLSRQGRWGTWRVRSARLGFRRGTPRLSKLSVPDGLEQRGLAVAQGFLADDRDFLLTAQLDTDPDSAALELYRVRVDASGRARAEPLTRSRGGFHEYARLSPRGDLVAFTSDAELPRGERRTEIWLMALDGSDKRRLTRFNESGAPPCYLGDLEWSPEGDRIVAQSICGEPTRKEALYLLELSETLRRPRAAPARR